MGMRTARMRFANSVCGGRDEVPVWLAQGNANVASDKRRSKRRVDLRMMTFFDDDMDVPRSGM